MALKAKRIEMMRQITKGPIEAKFIFVLVEIETNDVMGTYHNEALADIDAIELFKLYGIDTAIKSFPIDTCPDLALLK